MSTDVKLVAIAELRPNNWFLNRAREVVKMRFYSHRGMNRQAPENTLAAFQRAIDQGFDIELDVQMTKDGGLICFHDWQLGRTAPGDGMVWGYTMAELRALDAGAWFSKEFAGERIPTLHEALALAKDRARVAIEMKMPGIDEPVVEVISQLDMFEQVYVFDVPNDILLPTRLKAINPDVQVGRNFISEHDFLSTESDGFKDIDVIMAVTDSGWLTADHVERAHGRGVRVIDTAVHDRDKMLRCRELSVDGVCSDCPDEIASA